MFLDIDHLTMRFGGVIAVNDVTLSVKQGEIHGLIGPNGSGKTTIFNVVSGYYKPTSGTVSFEGQTISGVSAHQITAKGFARTFQNLRLFHTMTVLDNVLVGMTIMPRRLSGKSSLTRRRLNVKRKRSQTKPWISCS